MHRFDWDNGELIAPHYPSKYHILNFDTGDVVDTFENIEDAREFIRIYPDAKNCTIMLVESDGTTKFLDVWN